MPKYIRAYVPGGTYFFTVVTHRRLALFKSKSARSLWGNCLRECVHRWPFVIDAIVLLPDHLHAMWSLPSGDAEYSMRWAWLKKEFTKRWLANRATESVIAQPVRVERQRRVWQPRFWEHVIQDQHDYERHFDYIHYNPVKHGHVRCPRDWPHSSFHRWAKHGVYSANWACSDDTRRLLDFEDVAGTVGE